MFTNFHRLLKIISRNELKNLLLWSLHDPRFIIVSRSAVHILLRVLDCMSFGTTATEHTRLKFKTLITVFLSVTSRSRDIREQRRIFDKRADWPAIDASWVGWGKRRDATEGISVPTRSRTLEPRLSLFCTRLRCTEDCRVREGSRDPFGTKGERVSVGQGE